MRKFAKTTRALMEIVWALCASLCFRGEQNVGNAGNRRYRLPELKSWLCIVFVIACLLTNVSAQAQEPNEVLVLASYHPTMGWTKAVVGTIESELLRSGTDVEIHTEYMDTKHFSDRNHYTNLYTLFRDKAKREQYDVIITVDNNALLFLLKYRNELYPNVPIVFCGVDHHHDSMYERRPSKTTIEEILGGHNSVTGVLEEFDYERTIEVALQLHPSARRVILINDGINEVTYYPNLSEEDVTNLAERFAGRAEFENLLLTESNLNQVIEKIRQRREESVVLLTNTFLDTEANLSLLRGKFRTFCRRCDAPVYIVDGSLLQLGHLVGGYINEGNAQGKTAVDMALQILGGESPGNIPIITKSPNRYIFQHPYMKKFGISPADLPPGSVILNPPESFYYKYRSRIWTVIAIIAALALAVVILSVNILRRKKAEENLRVRNIAIESSIDAIAFADMKGKLTDVNSSFLKLWGYSDKKEVLGKPAVQFWADVDRATEVRRILVDGGNWVGELTAKRKDGSTFNVQLSSSPVKSEAGEPLCTMAAFVDITDRKQAEGALRENEERLRLALSAADMGTWRWDPVTNQDTRDANFNRILGLSAAGSTQPVEDFFQRVHPDDRDMVDKGIQCAIRDRQPYLAEFRVVRPDGAIRWLRDQGKVLCDENDRVSYMTGAVVDITERKKAEEELRQSEEKWRSLVENAPDVILTVGPDGTILFLNHTVPPFTPEKAVGTSIYDYVPDEYQDTLRKSLEHVLQTGEPYSYELAGKGPDGCTSWYQSRMGPIKHGGQVVAVILIATDITERKRAEKALRESEQRFRSLVETSSDWVWEIDQNGIYIYTSPKVKDLLGYEPEEIIGKTPFDLMPPDEAERVAELFNDIAESRKPFDGLENTNLHKDGRLVVLDTSGVPILDEGGNLLGYRGIDRDITERKQTEGALRQSENKYRTLLENLPQKIFLKDRNSVYLSYNENIAGDFKIRPEEIAGKTDYDFFPKELAEKYRADDKRLVEFGKTEDIEEEYIQEGREVVVRTVKTPIKDEQGNVIGILGIFWDITERKRAEEALQRAHDELETRVEQRTAELAKANVQLRSLAAELTLAEERLKHQIATNVHDNIGQNLAISKIKLESLRESQTSPELTASLDEISELIAQTIESSRLLTFELSPPVLYELGFEAAVEWLARRAREQHGLSTDFKTDGRPKPLAHDVRVLLFQAVRELLVNVAKHANAGNVTVSTRRVGGEIRVSVEDDGVGFDTSKISAQDYKASGFGLFSIRERLRSIGGRLDIDSRPGLGTCVTLVTQINHESKKNGGKRK